MIELKKICNLTIETANFIIEHRRKLRLPQTDDSENPKYLNQEKDGMILFTWDDAAESSKGSIVTHVGLYDPVTQKHQLIWTYNQRVQIVSCSINQARSLLAFTILHKDGTAGKKKEVYTAFLAEIQASSTRVFSLNLERPHFLKVQFLYSQVSAKECHMLVMLHRESIGLYRIQLGRVGEKGIVMRDQPSTEQLAKKFYWCQWDCQHQRLYYIQYQKQGKANNIKFQPVLSSLQFYEHAQHDNMMDIVINFPFPLMRTTQRQHYSTIPLHSGIPDPFLNLVVLTQSNSTFCICYQHLTETPYSVDRSRSSSRRSRKSPTHPSPSSLTMSISSDDDQMEMSYYICMVHHAKVLHGHVSGLPFSLKHRLHFSWHGDYLMVLLPGQFVHLLNVGIEYEPCHHILLQDKTLRLQAAVSSIGPSEEFQSSQADNTSTRHRTRSADTSTPIPVLSPEAERLSHLSNTCLFEIQRDTPKETCLFDHRNGDVWKVTVNMDALVHIFTQSYMPATRTALLHYVLIRTRDFWLVKRLFEMLSNDIASEEVPGLMAEFLSSTTYSSMRRQCDREILRLLPFTVAETFRGQYDKNQCGDWLARLSYSSMSSVKIGTRTAQERQKRNVADDMWDTLRRHLQWMQLNERSRRFSQDTVRKANQQLQRSNTASRPQTSKETSLDNKTFLSNFHTRINSNRVESHSPSLTIDGGKRVRPDTVLGVAPPFLQGSAITDWSDYLMNLTKELLSNHLIRNLRKDSKIKAQNVAKEYAFVQTQQSRQLCHLLWHLRGPLLPYTDLDLLPNLLDPSTEDEYELFQLFERYYLTCKDLVFPIPQGFSSYFTAVGFRTLSKCLFLQYVDRGVLSLTGDFIAQVLSDLSDEEDDVKLKHQLISRLPKNLAMECFRQWNHHSCQKYLATKQVTELLTGTFSPQPSALEGLRGQAVNYRSIDTRSTVSSRDNMTFPPLESFLQLLNKLDTADRKQQGAKVRRSPIDVHFLEEVSLYHTRNDTPYDLSTVNF